MRVVLIVLDSVGVGELPDADLYGDVGSNTLGNIKKKIENFALPNLCGLGLSGIDGVDYFGDDDQYNGSYGKLIQRSTGKDTTTGHWEIAGLRVKHPFPTYPDGFPKELIDEFEKITGYGVIGNVVASGTDIIKRLGKKHVKTEKLIVYTSADSVFQIAAHEDVVSQEKLIDICKKARELLVEKWNVSRVIARPFKGSSDNFERTSNRKDFSVEPFSPTMLDFIKDENMDVHSIGKISDIFANRGITKKTPTKNNSEGIDMTIEAISEKSKGLIFTNLVDFDSEYGHRRDYIGYAKALEEFDKRLPEITETLKDDDILMITADHGCDPTFKGTDHTREYIPLLIYGKNIKQGVNLGIRKTFSDIGKTILDYLDINNDILGESFLNQIKK